MDFFLTMMATKREGGEWVGGCIVSGMLGNAIKCDIFLRVHEMLLRKKCL